MAINTLPGVRVEPLDRPCWGCGHLFVPKLGWGLKSVCCMLCNGIVLWTEKYQQ